jgi:hypothetical protein
MRFLVVPDGVRDNRVRLSLSVTPEPAGPTLEAGEVDLLDWPAQVARACRDIRVLVGEVVDTPGVGDGRSVGSIRAVHIARPELPARYVAEATATWRRIFGPDPRATLTNLVIALGAGEVQPPPHDPKPPQMVGYNTAELTAALDTLSGAAAAATMASHLERALDIRGGEDVAIHDASRPGRGWWVHQYATWLGRSGPAARARGPVLKAAQAVLPQPDPAIALRVADHQTRLGGLYCSGSTFDPRSLGDLLSPRTASAESLFGERVHDQAYWRDGGGLVADRDLLQSERDGCRGLAEEMHRLELALQPCARPKDLDDDKDDADGLMIAGRKFSAILGYPTLAKFLNLIIDIEAPLDAFVAGDGRGVVAVDLAGSRDAPFPRGEQAIWTSYAATKGMFVPASRLGAAPAGYWLQNGLVNLGAELAPNKPRFQLVLDDGAMVAEHLMQKAEEAAQQHLEGQGPAEPDPIPPRQSRGIAFVDNGRAAFEAERRLREEQILEIRKANADQPPAAQAVHIRDLEDLIEGYRIDVELLPKPGTRNPVTSRWRTLCGREVRYRYEPGPGIVEYRDIPKAFLDEAADVAARDDGSVRGMTRIGNAVDLGPVIEQHDVLFTWQGDSLAVPALVERNRTPGQESETGDTVRPNPEQDLAIDVLVDLPSDPARRPPPLRINRDYRFGARVVLPNGCSVSLAEAAEGYKSLALGAAGGKPYTYRRSGQIRAPDLLLAWDDKLVTGKVMPPGETLDDLVVRAPGATTRRFLAPSGVSFALAEQHGLFDRTTENRPKGAFTSDAVRAQVNPYSGDYPVAANGGWRYPNLASPACPDSGKKLHLGAADPKPATVEKSRGPVLVLDDTACDPDSPRYPDPLGRFVWAQLLDEGQPCDFGALDEPLQFWRSGQQPRDALPVHLELRGRSKADLKNKRGRVRRGGAFTAAAWPANREVTTPSLVVELAPGETADLRIWADAEPDRLQNEHVIACEAVRRLARSGPGMSGARALGWALASTDPAGAIARAGSQGPIGLIQNYRTVRVVHAVQKPLEAPGFKFVSNPDRKLADEPAEAPSIHPVVVTVQSEAGQSVSQATSATETWAQYAARQDEDAYMSWPSQEGGSTTFFVGKVDTDRLTTGALRCEARWEDWGPNQYRLVDGAVRHLPAKARARLFAIDAEPVKRSLFGEAVDLLKEQFPRPDKRTYRQLAYSFADGRARRLELELVATSRFTNFYPPGPATDFERSSEERDARRAQVWVPCTFRPPVPEVERVLPIFRWTKTVRNRREITFTRETGLRIYLKPTWYASGEGEMLGVVLPITAGRTRLGDPAVCSLDDIGRFGQFVTRWGVDPVHHSGPSDGLLAPRDLIPKAKDDPRRPVDLGPVGSSSPDPRPREFRLRLADPKGAGDAPAMEPPFLPVQVLGYRPKEGPEGPYCDLAIDVGDTYFPFVQLGLTRLQVHSVADLELSHPVAEFAQAPPKRSITVQFKDLKRFDVLVDGVGYNDAKGLAALPAEMKLPRGPLPVVRIRILEAVNADRVEPHGDSIRWKPVLKGGTPKDYEAAPTAVGGKPHVLRWKAADLELPFPRTADAHRYAILVEEYEVMPQRDEAEAQLRGPFLSRIIDLRPWRDDGDEASLPD